MVLVEEEKGGSGYRKGGVKKQRRRQRVFVFFFLTAPARGATNVKERWPTLHRRAADRSLCEFDAEAH